MHIHNAKVLNWLFPIKILFNIIHIFYSQMRGGMESRVAAF